MTPRHDIDSAIDHVAKRLTHVDHDAAFTARIVGALPERTATLGWLIASWASALAVVALAAMASTLLNNRESAPGVAELLDSSPIVVATALRASVEPAESGTQPLEPVELLEPLEPLRAGRPDHEFSLAGLDVEALPPMNLPAAASIDLEPLTIVDLPLTGEFPEQK